MNNADFEIAHIILRKIYRDLKIVNHFESRIYYAKKITIKIILNKCQCKTCIDAAYFIHTINFIYE
jgi:hypothetical protein